MKEKEAANYLKAILERDYNDGFHCEEEAALKKAIKLFELDILNTPIIELALAQFELGHKKGFEEGYSKAENDYYAKTKDDRQTCYELGLNMAWEAAKKIDSYCGNNKPLDEMFGEHGIADIKRHFTASEAIEKINAYEEQKKQTKDEIKVGDEVVSNNGDKGIVLCCYHETDDYGNWKEEWLVVYMSNYNVPQIVTKKRFKKTGKRYDVMSILEKMQEDEE